MKRNRIAFVIDRSNSMYPFVDQVVESFNQQLDEIRSNDRKFDQQTLVSILTFDNPGEENLIRFDQPATSVSYLNRAEVAARGNTALYDAVGMMIDRYHPLFKKDRKNGKDRRHSYLVMVLTDGEENQSRHYTAADLRQQIQTMQSTDYWTFTFQVPRGYKQKLVNLLNIPEGNVVEWQQTRIGYEETMLCARSGLTNHYTNVAKGKMSSRSLFTDLSQLSKEKVVNNLDDLSHKFKMWKVDKELDIKTFVEYHTARPYVTGSTFYQLTKPEKVQPSKQLLVQEKGKKTVYGGDQARDLIGLPRGQDAKVHPGNHANWDLYIESRSVNRKLVRGTKVLVDVTKITSAVPTWQTT